MSSTSSQPVSHVHRDDEGSRLGMWLFLFTELILFGGMFLVFAVYKFTYYDEFHKAATALNTLVGALNTVILLTSSLTMALSIAVLQNGKKELSLFFQLVTVLLAFGFLINKYVEWSAKINLGVFPGSDTLLALGNGEVLFYGLYYLMTGLHALHVIFGVFLILYMTNSTYRDKITQDNFVRLESAGLYWHLVDVIWIFLFPLFYLIS